MSKYPFADAILHQTDGGLQIIKDYYPEAATVSETSSKKFKIRPSEKAAANLKFRSPWNNLSKKKIR